MADEKTVAKQPRRGAGVCFDCMSRTMRVLYRFDHKKWVCPTCAAGRLAGLETEIDKLMAEAKVLNELLAAPVPGQTSIDAPV